MAFLKLYRHARQYGMSASLKKLLTVMPSYLSRVYLWRIRRCNCCHHFTIFLSAGASESSACLFCSANQRYEMLAMEIEQRFGETLSQKDVLELDPHSPLRRILSRARTYTRSFYESGTQSGWRRADGSVCQDISALSLSDQSLDLIISSEVLEHVPLLDRAFGETARVLRPGGAHLFTVPPRPKTKMRAQLVDGKVAHIETPEYHGDPLCRQGILTFWDIGPDLPEKISSPTLNIRIAQGPIGDAARIVWIAQRRELD
jgi:SAM-dependent methyltransferase